MMTTNLMMTTSLMMITSLMMTTSPMMTTMHPNHMILTTTVERMRERHPEEDATAFTDSPDSTARTVSNAPRTDTGTSMPTTEKVPVLATSPSNGTKENAFQTVERRKDSPQEEDVTVNQVSSNTTAKTVLRSAPRDHGMMPTTTSVFANGVSS